MYLSLLEAGGLLASLNIKLKTEGTCEFYSHIRYFHLESNAYALSPAFSHISSNNYSFSTVCLLWSRTKLRIYKCAYQTTGKTGGESWQVYAKASSSSQQQQQTSVQKFNSESGPKKSKRERKLAEWISRAKKVWCISIEEEDGKKLSGGTMAVKPRKEPIWQRSCKGRVELKFLWSRLRRARMEIRAWKNNGAI